MKKTSFSLMLLIATFSLSFIEVCSARGARISNDRNLAPRDDNRVNANDAERRPNENNVRRYDNSAYVSERHGDGVGYKKYYYGGIWYYPKTSGRYTLFPFECGGKFAGYGYYAKAAPAVGWRKMNCGYWAPPANN